MHWMWRCWMPTCVYVQIMYILQCHCSLRLHSTQSGIFFVQVCMWLNAWWETKLFIQCTCLHTPLQDYSKEHLQIPPKRSQPPLPFQSSHYHLEWYEWSFHLYLHCIIHVIHGACILQCTCIRRGLNTHDLHLTQSEERLSFGWLERSVANPSNWNLAAQKFKETVQRVYWFLVILSQIAFMVTTHYLAYMYMCKNRIYFD